MAQPTSTLHLQHIQGQNLYELTQPIKISDRADKTQDTDTLKEPVVDNEGNLNSTLLTIANPVPGRQTYQNIARLLKDEIPLPNGEVLFVYELYIELLQIKHQKPIHQILLIGSGAIHAIDKQEKIEIINTSGAQELLNDPNFIEQLERPPNDIDWRITLYKKDDKDLIWDDTTFYIQAALIILAKRAGIINPEGRTLKDLCKQLDIKLDISLGKYYVLRFKNIPLDIAIGYFEVRCLFDDTNAQIAVRPNSITSDLSRLNLSYETEGMNLLQALTYRGKRIICSRNPKEKDYRTIFQVIRHMMSDHACYSNESVSIYMKTFILHFHYSKGTWQFHAARIICNIFKSHKNNSLRDILWATYHFETLLIKYCPIEFKDLCLPNQLRRIWVELIEYVKSNDAFSESERSLIFQQDVIKLKIKEENAQALIASIITLSSFLNYHLKPGYQQTKIIFTDTFSACRIEAENNQNSLLILSVCPVQLALKNLKKYFRDNPDSGSNTNSLLNLVAEFCPSKNLRFQTSQTDSLPQEFEEAAVKWVHSENDFLILIGSLLIASNCSTLTSKSAFLLFTAIIPKLLQSPSPILSSYGRSLALWLAAISPDSQATVSGIIQDQPFSADRWLIALAESKNENICSIAAKSISQINLNTEMYLRCWKGILTGSSSAALDLLEEMLDNIPFTPTDCHEILKCCFQKYSAETSSRVIDSRVNALIELASRLVDYPETDPRILKWIQQLVQTLRPDLAIRCLYWLPAFSENAYSTSGIDLAFYLLSQVKNAEDKIRLKDYIKRLIHLSNIQELLLSHSFIRAFQETKYHLSIWEHFLLHGSSNSPRKASLALRWLISTRDEIPADSSINYLWFIRLFDEAMGEYKEKHSHEKPCSLPILEKLFVAAWKHPLFTPENAKAVSELARVYLVLQNKMIAAQDYKILSLVEYSLDNGVYDAVVRNSGTASDLYSLLKALIYSQECAWKAALQVAELLKMDMTLNAGGIDTLLSHLSLLLHHASDNEGLHRLAAIASARESLKDLSVQFKLDALGYELHHSLAKAEETLISILGHDNRIKNEYYQMPAIIDKMLKNALIEDKPAAWFISSACRKALGNENWLGLAVEFLAKKSEKLLFAKVMSVYQNESSSVPRTSLSKHASFLLAHPLLCEGYESSAIKWETVSVLISYAHELDDSCLGKMIEIIQGLNDDKCYDQCAEALLLLHSKCHLTCGHLECFPEIVLNCSEQNRSLLLKTFAKLLKQESWLPVWSRIHENCSGIDVKELFQTWSAANSIPKETDAPLGDIHLFIFFTLLTTAPNLVLPFLGHIKSILGNWNAPFVTEKNRGPLSLVLANQLIKHKSSNSADVMLFVDHFRNGLEDQLVTTLIDAKISVMSIRESNKELLAHVFPTLLKSLKSLSYEGFSKSDFVNQIKKICLLAPFFHSLGENFREPLLDFISLIYNHPLPPPCLIALLNWLIQLNTIEPAILLKKQNTVIDLFISLLKNNLKGFLPNLQAIVEHHKNSIFEILKSNMDLCEIPSKGLIVTNKLVSNKLLRAEEWKEIIGPIAVRFITKWHDTNKFIHNIEEVLNEFSLYYQLIYKSDNYALLTSKILFETLIDLIKKHKQRKLFTQCFRIVFNHILLITNTEKQRVLYSMNEVDHDETASLNSHIKIADCTNLSALFFIQRLQMTELMLNCKGVDINVFLALFEHSFILVQTLLLSYKSLRDKAAWSPELATVVADFLFLKRSVPKHLDRMIRELKSSCMCLANEADLFKNHETLKIELIIYLNNYNVPNIRNIPCYKDAVKALIKRFFSSDPDRVFSVYRYLLKSIHTDRCFDGRYTEEYDLYQFITKQLSECPIESMVDNKIITHLEWLIRLMTQETWLNRIPSKNIKLKTLELSLVIFRLLCHYTLLEKDITDITLQVALISLEKLFDRLIDDEIFSSGSEDLLTDVEAWDYYGKFTSLLISFSSNMILKVPTRYQLLVKILEKYCLISGHKPHLLCSTLLEKRKNLAHKALKSLFVNYPLKEVDYKELIKTLIKKHPQLFNNPCGIYSIIPDDISSSIPALYTHMKDHGKAHFLYLTTVLKGLIAIYAKDPLITPQHKIFIRHSIRFLHECRKNNAYFVDNNLIEHCCLQIWQNALSNSHGDQILELIIEGMETGCFQSTDEHANRLFIQSLAQNMTGLIPVAGRLGWLCQEPYLTEKQSQIVNYLRTQIKEPISGNPSLEELIKKYLETIWSQGAFQDTSWTWDILQRIAADPLNEIWNKGIHYATAAEQYDAVLEMARYLRRGQPIPDATAKSIFNAVTCLFEKGRQKELLPLFVEFVLSETAQVLSSMDHLYPALLFAQLIQHLPYDFFDKGEENFINLFYLFEHCIFSTDLKKLNPKEISILYDCSQSLSDLLVTLNKSPCFIYDWAKKYFIYFNERGHGEIGAELLFCVISNDFIPEENLEKEMLTQAALQISFLSEPWIVDTLDYIFQRYTNVLPENDPDVMRVKLSVLKKLILSNNDEIDGSDLFLNTFKQLSNLPKGQANIPLFKELEELLPLLVSFKEYFYATSIVDILTTHGFINEEQALKKQGNLLSILKDRGDNQVLFELIVNNERTASHLSTDEKIQLIFDIYSTADQVLVSEILANSLKIINKYRLNNEKLLEIIYERIKDIRINVYETISFILFLQNTFENLDGVQQNIHLCGKAWLMVLRSLHVNHTGYRIAYLFNGDIFNKIRWSFNVSNQRREFIALFYKTCLIAQTPLENSDLRILAAHRPTIITETNELSSIVCEGDKKLLVYLNDNIQDLSLLNTIAILLCRIENVSSALQDLGKLVIFGLCQLGRETHPCDLEIESRVMETVNAILPKLPKLSQLEIIQQLCKLESLKIRQVVLNTLKNALMKENASTLTNSLMTDCYKIAINSFIRSKANDLLSAKAYIELITDLLKISIFEDLFKMNPAWSMLWVDAMTTMYAKIYLEETKLKGFIQALTSADKCLKYVPNRPDINLNILTQIVKNIVQFLFKTGNEQTLFCLKDVHKSFKNNKRSLPKEQKEIPFKGTEFPESYFHPNINIACALLIIDALGDITPGNYKPHLCRKALLAIILYIRELISQEPQDYLVKSLLNLIVAPIAYHPDIFEDFRKHLIKYISHPKVLEKMKKFPKFTLFYQLIVDAGNSDVQSLDVATKQTVVQQMAVRVLSRPTWFKVHEVITIIQNYNKTANTFQPDSTPTHLLLATLLDAMKRIAAQDIYHKKTLKEFCTILIINLKKPTKEILDISFKTMEMIEQLLADKSFNLIEDKTCLFECLFQWSKLFIHLSYLEAFNDKLDNALKSLQKIQFWFSKAIDCCVNINQKMKINEQCLKLFENIRDDLLTESQTAAKRTMMDSFAIIDSTKRD